MSIIYVSPTGSGKKSGSSATNALPIASLDKAIQLAGAGGTVYMLADKGSYTMTTAVSLYHGGTSSAPVTVMGVDSYGHAANIQVNGTRPAVYSPTNDPGNETFKLMAGANNLVFENMNFSNVGTAFRVGADVSNITIQNMAATNVRRFFEDYASGSAPTATIAGLTIQNVAVTGFSKDVVRLQYDTHDVLIQNVFGDSQHQDGDGIAEGIALEGTVHNVMIRHTTMENAVSSSSTYWNGDGFTTEAGVYNVTLEDTLARGNADGGYDLKSKNTTLIRAVAEDNGRNFRLWGTATLNDVVGLDPHKYGGTTGGQEQIQFMNGSKVTVNGGEFVDSGSSTYVVLNDGGGTISFNNTHFVYAQGAHFTTGANISGISSSNVTVVQPTGQYSANGDVLLASIGAAAATSNAGIPSTASSSVSTGNGSGGTVGSAGTGTGGSSGGGSQGGGNGGGHHSGGQTKAGTAAAGQPAAAAAFQDAHTDVVDLGHIFASARNRGTTDSLLAGIGAAAGSSAVSSGPASHPISIDHGAVRFNWSDTHEGRAALMGLQHQRIGTTTTDDTPHFAAGFEAGHDLLHYIYHDPAADHLGL